MNDGDTLGSLMGVVVDSGGDTVIAHGSLVQMGLITGRIDSATAERLDRTSIHIVEVNRTVDVDAEGFFVIAALPPGEYTIQVRVDEATQVPPWDADDVPVEEDGATALIPGLPEPWEPAATGETLQRRGGMVLVKARGHGFSMGSLSGFPDERPVHPVWFTRDFWMDTTEVIQSDFEALMGSNPSVYVWHDLPVANLTWCAAALYCNERSKRDDLDTVYVYGSVLATGNPPNYWSLMGLKIDMGANGYRLPTEAEWEYACRAGSTGDHFWNSDSTGTTYAWYGFGSVDSSQTSAVGHKRPNAYGLHEMAGNVYELCNDWYGPYSAKGELNPTGPALGVDRVARGGARNSSAFHLRSSCRNVVAPTDGNGWVGFRAVLPVTQ